MTRRVICPAYFFITKNLPILGGYCFSIFSPKNHSPNSHTFAPFPSPFTPRCCRVAVVMEKRFQARCLEALNYLVTHPGLEPGTL